MARMTCPSCGESITGTLAELASHQKSCGSKTGKKVKSTPLPRRIPPVKGPMPDLPFSQVVSMEIQSQNRSQYSHWTRYARYKDAWFTTLNLSLPRLQGRMFQWSLWRFTRIYAGRQRPLDYGNLVGGAKPLPDALIVAGIIVDDDPKHFKAQYEQIEGEKPGTLIELLEIAPHAKTD